MNSAGSFTGVLLMTLVTGYIARAAFGIDLAEFPAWAASEAR